MTLCLWWLHPRLTTQPKSITHWQPFKDKNGKLGSSSAKQALQQCEGQSYNCHATCKQSLRCNKYEKTC